MRGKKIQIWKCFLFFIFLRRINWSLCSSTDLYKLFLLGWEPAPLASLCSRVLGTVGSWIWTGEPQYAPTLVLWPAGIFCASSNFACGSQWPKAALRRVVVIPPNLQPSFLHAWGQKPPHCPQLPAPNLTSVNAPWQSRWLFLCILGVDCYETTGREVEGSLTPWPCCMVVVWTELRVFGAGCGSSCFSAGITSGVASSWGTSPRALQWQQLFLRLPCCRNSSVFS